MDLRAIATQKLWNAIFIDHPITGFPQEKMSLADFSYGFQSWLPHTNIPQYVFCNEKYSMLWVEKFEHDPGLDYGRGRGACV